MYDGCGRIREVLIELNVRALTRGFEVVRLESFSIPKQVLLVVEGADAVYAIGANSQHHGRWMLSRIYTTGFGGQSRVIDDADCAGKVGGVLVWMTMYEWILCHCFLMYWTFRWLVVCFAT